MKTLILSICATLAATTAFAGDIIVDPVAETQSGSGDGALLLLALLGVVIASSAIGGMATRNTSTMDISPTDIDEN